MIFNNAGDDSEDNNTDNDDDGDDQLWSKSQPIRLKGIPENKEKHDLNNSHDDDDGNGNGDGGDIDYDDECSCLLIISVKWCFKAVDTIQEEYREQAGFHFL